MGSGSLGMQIHHFLKWYSDHEVLGFLDDYDQSPGVLGKLDQVGYFRDKIDLIALGIGYKHLGFKENLFGKLKEEGFDFVTFIHPSSVIDKSASIGEGCIIYPGVIIDQGVKIGQNTLINNGVIVSHDSAIGYHSFIAPGVVFSGSCLIGNKCFIGSGTILKENISIVDEVVIGAGSLVLKSIDKKGTYFGHPIK